MQAPILSDFSRSRVTKKILPGPAESAVGYNSRISDYLLLPL